ncbi:MAG: 16S rRNA (adenine1518-N6/adenine1519-N6)-dimethyltransferase [Planctomycetota bacterium]|jgi:16S rRNA (adenine1518-N6/adenine1519-N6)-dimethyltransferase
MSDSLTDRPAWATLRGLLEAEGFRPSKSLGQNFLVDANMARAIARDAQVQKGEHVLEVGPGCASLSMELAALGVDLVCVEIDARLARIARKVLAPYPAVRILETDVLGKKSSLAEPVTEILDDWGKEPWHLAANLPYAVSGPVMVVLSRRPVPPNSITVLVQREVAERIAAKPGTRQHGPLGLKLAPLYTASLVRSVPAGLFWPQPRVESSVLRLERRAEDPGSLVAYDRLVDGLFQRRRKTLRAALGAHLGDPGRAGAALAQAGLDPVARAETLSWRSLRELEFALAPAEASGS